MKITDAIQEFIRYKQSLGMSYRGRALKLNALVRLTGPVEIDSVDSEMVLRYLDGDRPITTEWGSKYSALKVFSRFALARGYAIRNPQSAAAFPAEVPQAVPALYLLDGRSANNAARDR